MTLYDFFDLIWPILGTVATTTISIIGAYFMKKIKNEYIRELMVRFSDACGVAVREVEQAYTNEIRKAQDPNSQGGKKITKEEGKKAMWLAKECAKSYIGSRGIYELIKVFGINDFESKLESRLEAALFDAKKENPTQG